MSQVIDFEYKDGIIEHISNWTFGTNWPAVYIFYNDQKAYVGETLDLVRRTEQHLSEKEFDGFTNVCLISDKTFNKSVVLDLEAFLIKYMSADGTRRLTNGNAGIANHNYFYKEAYEDDFKDIWNLLMKDGIVSKSLIDIENSELFKYSPYKSLNREQQKAAYEILKRIYEINNASFQSIIEVIGGAGTGKTILAVYLIKLLVDIKNNKNVWKSIEDEEDSAFIQRISTCITGICNVGFVVPMVELRNTMKSIFDSIDGLNSKMILAPSEVVGNMYDVLIVDEAHRLYRRHHLPGQHMYAKFDRVNEQLMGEISGTVDDLTELDWIIKSSRIQVLFYDQLQTIRATDINRERFEEICRPHLYKYIELLSQMRCNGGNGYYEYVKTVLASRDLNASSYKRIQDYELKVVDDVSELFTIIENCNSQVGLSKVVTGPGWSKEQDIEIDGNTYHWANERNVGESEDLESVYSIHKIQGFDLNYAGVIIGDELFYDTEKKSLEVRKNALKDNHTKSSGDESMRQFVLNIYTTLMTRGIRGTFVYAVDKNLNDYLKKYFN